MKNFEKEEAQIWDEDREKEEDRQARTENFNFNNTVKEKHTRY